MTAVITVVSAFAAGRGDDAAALVFEYMAATQAETGKAVPAGIGELPAVLQRECRNLQAVYRPPGALLIADHDGQPAGCAGLASGHSWPRPPPQPAWTRTGSRSCELSASSAARSPARRHFPPGRLERARETAIAEILERVSKGRRKRTYPRVIKKYKGRTFPVKQPGQTGQRHDLALEIRRPLVALLN